MKPKISYRTLLNPAVILKIIIYANIFMFVISLLFSKGKMINSINPLFLLTPGMDVLIFLGASGKAVILTYGNWWSLITANWLHGSLLHIFFNMMALRVLVPLIINEFGVSRMFTIYTLTGAFGFFMSYIGNVPVTIGASSGLCGLIGAAFYFGKSRGGEWGMLVYKQTTGWVISLAAIGFVIPNIDNWGHAGGLLSGIFFGWLLGYSEKRRESIVDKIIALSFSTLTFWLLSSAVIQAFRSRFF